MLKKLYEKARFRIAGDRGLLVEYGEGIDLQVNRKVRAMTVVMEQKLPLGIVEVIPTYRSLLVIYDPGKITLQNLKVTMLELEEQMVDIHIPPPKIVEIPVCYGGEFGPDIQFVAESHNLEIEEVVQMHSQPVYPIYMIGFTPGFPFLGGLLPNLHTPRLETPRIRVPEGSVGIANAQTGIYPIASPGGWQIIGRTPLKLFSPQKKKPFLYQAGDMIHFDPIQKEAYHRILEDEAS